MNEYLAKQQDQDVRSLARWLTVIATFLIIFGPFAVRYLFQGRSVRQPFLHAPFPVVHTNGSPTEVILSKSSAMRGMITGVTELGVFPDSHDARHPVAVRLSRRQAGQ